MDLLKTLDEVIDADRLRVGGKAYNCARLKQAGFPVPDGLVVPSTMEESEIVARLSGHPWLKSLPPDARFAVRSSGLAEDSATDSFAGIFETDLNVSQAKLTAAVLKIRRSADSEQARAYRAARDLQKDEGRCGVLVQRMVPAVRSGVAFTINPVTGADELVVESVDGLGDALVSGQVNPDEQVMAKTDRSALAQLLVAVERHFGSPQDVEWCFDGERYWIVQSRPVTTKVRDGMSAAAPTEGREAIEWTRANLAEVFPEQLSPQALDVYVRLLNVGEREFFGRLLAPESELGPIVAVFFGRPYFNLSQLRHITNSVGSPFASTLRSLGHPEKIRAEDEIVPRLSLGRIVRILPDILRLARYDLGMARMFRENQAFVASSVGRLTRVDPQTLSDLEIWNTIEWWESVGPQAIPVILLLGNVQRREEAVRKICEKVGFRFEDLVFPLLAAGRRSVSSQQAFDLIELASVARREPEAAAYFRAGGGAFADFRTALAGTNFLREFEGFLAAYGHRGRYESDWSIPRMRENPAAVLFAIREQLDGAPQDPAALFGRQSAAAAAAWQAFGARLSWWQRWTVLPGVKKKLAQLKQQYLWREEVRSDLTKVLAALRPWHLVLAGRFVERGWIDRPDDYFFLLLSEVHRACEDPGYGGEFRALVKRRAAQRAAERDLPLPLFMRESELRSLMDASAMSLVSGEVLEGLCVSPGRVEGEVVVLRDPGEFAMMKRGAILVAPATDPSWTPLFTLASGVIVEVGGMLSHASTIAREYGLPALANVRNATRALKNGDRVFLDASGGLVHRVSRP